MDHSISSGSENDELNAEYASVFNVGSYFIDLGQYQTEMASTSQDQKMMKTIKGSLRIHSLVHRLL